MGADYQGCRWPRGPGSCVVSIGFCGRSPRLWGIVLEGAELVHAAYQGLALDVG